MNTIHTYKVESIDGGIIDMSGYEGKKIMIVNVASECGYTAQYAQLQELFDYFKDKLVVIGFPCNDFGGQEPGSEADIKQFCSLKFGISFPMTSKINIKSQPQHPVFQWLSNKSLNGKLDTIVQWNFHKFLLDEKGQILADFPSSVQAMDESILEIIQ